MANERIVRDDLNYLEAREISQYFTVVFWAYISIRYLMQLCCLFVVETAEAREVSLTYV